MVTMVTMHKQTITFTVAQADFLKSQADVLDISVADLVRRIVDDYRARESQAKVRHMMSLQERFGADYPGLLGDLAGALVGHKIDMCPPWRRGHVLTEDDLRCTPYPHWTDIRLLDQDAEAKAAVIRTALAQNPSAFPSPIATP